MSLDATDIENMTQQGMAARRQRIPLPDGVAAAPAPGWDTPPAPPPFHLVNWTDDIVPILQRLYKIEHQLNEPARDPIPPVPPVPLPIPPQLGWTPPPWLTFVLAAGTIVVTALIAMLHTIVPGMDIIAISAAVLGALLTILSGVQALLLQSHVQRMQRLHYQLSADATRR